MSRLARLSLLVLLLACPATAAEPESQEPVIQQIDWGATFIGQYMFIKGSSRNQNRGDFFDQYQWVPNKDSDFPAELGIRDGFLNLVGADDTPLLQARLASPTSNLGISGSQVDEPFFNQRIDVLSRDRGLALDLHYDRIRTEQLRLFPNTAGAGLLFDDRSSPNDRFFRDRTGIAGELRVRPGQAFDALGDLGERLSPQLSLRGGYQARGGRRQLLLHRDPSNEWLGLSQKADRSVWDVGTGLILSPADGVTVNVDYDYERFQFDSRQLLEADLGYPAPEGARTIRFVPDTQRNTLILGLQSAFASRAKLRAGFRYSDLQQIQPFTPIQRAAGLVDNRVRSYAANADLSIDLRPGMALRTDLAWNRRSNDINRGTSAFNAGNGTQVDPFLRRFDRIVARLELVQRLPRRGSLTVGLRYEGILRDLDFGRVPPRILPANTWVDDQTQLVSVYARGSLRPMKRARLFGELGYRAAPKTGYITELDNLVYGTLRASYVVPTERPVIVTGFLRGRRGDNSDFTAVSGQGPIPAGPVLPRHFERSAIGGGVTVSHSPATDVSIHASFYGGENEQEAGLDQSTLQRTVQDNVPIAFSNAGVNRFHDRQLSFITGLTWRMSQRVDALFSYSFTNAKGLYGGGPASSELARIAESHRIDSDIHGLDLELGSWLREGMRVLAGYRLQSFSEHVGVAESIASAVPPGDRDTYQHTYTLGVTLTSDFFSRR